MTIETVYLTFWLASGTIRQSPVTEAQCHADLHVMQKWADVQRASRRGGYLAFDGDAILMTACVPMVLDACVREGS